MSGEKFTLSGLRFQPATPSRWADIEKLFGERGACAGCWCMVWRRNSRDYTSGKGAGNKRAFKKVVTSGERPGVIAYDGKEPIGWCAVAPRTVYIRLEGSRVLKPVDDKPVWSVSCFFVLRPYRRKGVSVRLLRAATEFAKKRGAKIVEGYPVEPTMEKFPDAFAWTGIPATFHKAGFKEVARRSPTRPVMRRVV